MSNTTFTKVFRLKVFFSKSINRYRLLCEDLLKHFPKEEEEIYKKLEDATKSIKEVTMYCNSKQKEIENLQKMNEISIKLGIKDLVLPSRTFVKHDEREGVLRIRDKTGGTIAVYSLYLFTDLLVCVSQKQTIGTKIFQIPLAPLSSNDVIRIEDLKSFENGIEIYNSNCQPLKLIFPDNERKEEWLNLLMDQISQKRNSIILSNFNINENN